MKLIKKLSLTLEDSQGNELNIKATDQRKFSEYCFYMESEQEPIFIFTKEDIKKVLEHLT